MGLCTFTIVYSFIAKEATHGSKVEITYSVNGAVKIIKVFDFCKESIIYGNRTCPVKPGRL